MCLKWNDVSAVSARYQPWLCLMQMQSLCDEVRVRAEAGGAAEASLAVSAYVGKRCWAPWAPPVTSHIPRLCDEIWVRCPGPCWQLCQAPLHGVACPHSITHQSPTQGLDYPHTSLPHPNPAFCPHPPTTPTPITLTTPTHPHRAWTTCASASTAATSAWS